MLKKLLIPSFIFVASLNTAMAANNYTYQANPKAYTPYKNYKGEMPHEVTTSNEYNKFPCRTFVISPGPYVSLNPGVRTNYSENGSAYKAFEGTLFGGYAYLYNNFYFAGEVFAQHGTQLQNYRNNLNNNLNPIGLKTTWGLGLSLLPGLVLADTILGYLRFGGVETHFLDGDSTALGGQVGVGLEGAVSESWDVRAEYKYTFYQSVNYLGSPRSDQFEVGVVYKFWG